VSRVAGQGDVSAREAAEAARYRDRTVRALKIVAANRPYSRPYGYAVEWMREAAEHANDAWYVEALLRQAHAFGIPDSTGEPAGDSTGPRR